MKKSPVASVVLAVKKAIGPGLALIWAGIACASPLIVGNNAGSAPITTYDLASGGVIESFVPDRAHGESGRAIAIAGNEIFYAEIGADEDVHVCPFNGGAGGADTRTLPDPRPGVAIQDLAFFGGYLYALTGYAGTGGNAEVFKLDPTTGAVQASVLLGYPPSRGSDGFVVLPNGNFLINDYDASSTYREYDSNTGLPTGFSLVVPGAYYSTGVDICSDGQSLYFATDFNSFTETDLAGNFLSKTIVTREDIEDIAIVPGSACATTNGCFQILCSPNIVVESALCTNEPVNYAVTVIGPCTNSVNLVCTPPSGSSFPMGSTAVHCVATNTVTGDSLDCDFTVTVVNSNCFTNTCVQILCPTNMVVAGCTNTTVNYFVTVVDQCGSNTLVCTPPSGYAFPIGTTNVHCIATDISSGESTSCDFTVTVLYSNCVDQVSISRQNIDIQLDWRMLIGHTAYVQVAQATPGGGFTNIFANVGNPIFVPGDPAIFVPGNGYVLTNFTFGGVLTNHPAVYYRIRFVP